MPNDQQIEYWVSNLQYAIDQLTKQVSRLAYAAEVQAMQAATIDNQPADPCPLCGCMLIIGKPVHCPACKYALPR